MKNGLMLDSGFKHGNELVHIMHYLIAKKWFVAILDENEEIRLNTVYYDTRTQCFNAIRTDSLVWVQERVPELLGELQTFKNETGCGYMDVDMKGGAE